MPETEKYSIRAAGALALAALAIADSDKIRALVYASIDEEMQMPKIWEEMHDWEEKGVKIGKKRSGMDRVFEEKQ